MSGTSFIRKIYVILSSRGLTAGSRFTGSFLDSAVKPQNDVNKLFKILLCLGLFFVLFNSLTAQVDLSSDEFEEAEKPEKIVVIDLSDDGYMVDQVQAEFIIRSLDEAEDKGTTQVVLVIDTFGGVVFSAREIAERILRSKIPVTAYVKTKAISAGTFIAWACHRIVMQDLTTMGDAQAIQQTADGIKEAPEKFLTVYRSDWKKSSDLRNRSFALARGFFEATVQVLWVQKNDQKSFMLQSEYDALSKREKKKTKILRVICEKDKLLTLHAKEAVELEIVEPATNLDEFLATLAPKEAIENVEMTRNEGLLRFFGANKWLFFILTLIGLNGLYAEIKAPGFGISGLTAVVCFTLVFGTRYLLGTANEIEIALFVLGVLLCLAEIFVIPGFGVVGIAGMVCMFAALVFASLPGFSWPQTDFEKKWFDQTAQLMLVCFLLSWITFLVALPVFFRIPAVKKRLLDREFRADQGYVVGHITSSDLVGQTGVVEGDLKPSGKARLDDGRLLDVFSQMGYIDAGSKIKVVKVDGPRIVVVPENSGDVS